MHVINALLDPDADEKLVKSSIILDTEIQHPKYCNFIKPVSDCEQVYAVGFRVCQPIKPCGSRLQTADNTQWV